MAEKNPEPVIGDGTIIVLICPECGNGKELKPAKTPLDAGHFIFGVAECVKTMQEEHKCPPVLKVV